MVLRVKMTHPTAQRSSPALEVGWTVKVPDEETLFVPPTMLRMRPRVIMSWVARNWSMWNILVEFELSESTLYRFVSLSDRWRRGKVLSAYQRESRPRVAKSKGEIPTESRMKAASRSPDDWSW